MIAEIWTGKTRKVSHLRFVGQILYDGLTKDKFPDILILRDEETDKVLARYRRER